MQSAALARFATVHWLKYAGIVTPDKLALGELPAHCVSYKIGPDGPVGPDGLRVPSNVWCAVALFAERAAAEAALQTHERFLPSLHEAIESWHALLLPIAHRGECNHLERANPRPLFEIGAEDPGGPLFVMTTAGYVPPPELERIVDFRVHVDKVRHWLESSIAGRAASQVFAPHTLGDDGVTMTLWQSDAAMIDAMYRPGVHRTQIDRHKRDRLADRTSFTRFRVLATRGTWGGSDPLTLARGAAP
jgi:hypothetical protein